MSFLLKSAFWLALVFLVLPQNEAERVKIRNQHRHRAGHRRPLGDGPDPAGARCWSPTEAQRLCEGQTRIVPGNGRRRREGAIAQK